MSFNGNLYGVDAGEDLTTKGDIHGYDTKNNRIPVGADNQVLTADSTTGFGIAWKAASGGGGNIYGDSSDGAGSITTNTNISAEKNYSSLTVDAGITLDYTGAQGDIMLIRVDGTCTINGTVSNDGNGMSGGSGGAGGDNPSMNTENVAGENGNSGTGAFGQTQNSSTGGDGGQGMSFANGGTGAVAVGASRPVFPDAYWTPTNVNNLLPQVLGAGGGGGAGGGTGNVNVRQGGNGGAGGLGGGCIIIFAKTLVIGAAGKITANGANGSNGSQAWSPSGNGSGGGGGGGGGSGGGVIGVYQSITNNGAIEVNGGSGGSGGAKRCPDGSGACGSTEDGDSGGSGNSGFTQLILDS